MFVFDKLSFIRAYVLGYQSINNKLIKLFSFYKYIYGILYCVHSINIYIWYTVFRRYIVTGC